MMNDKITEQHLQRSAYVYIRQSSLQQVRNNRERHRRQYALQERARELGFKGVEVIDEDLGITGSGQRERPGSSRLLSLVCNGEAGGVFALEASRLARNNRDWHHLIDLCVLTETVVVDAEGVYDPRLLDDRLLLGLKGTMSEFELGILRRRSVAPGRHSPELLGACAALFCQSRRGRRSRGEHLSRRDRPALLHRKGNPPLQAGCAKHPETAGASQRALARLPICAGEDLRRNRTDAQNAAAGSRELRAQTR